MIDKIFAKPNAIHRAIAPTCSIWIGSHVGMGSEASIIGGTHYDEYRKHRTAPPPQTLITLETVRAIPRKRGVRLLTILFGMKNDCPDLEPFGDVARLEEVAD